MFKFKNYGNAVTFTELADFFLPSENITHNRTKGKWNAERYETADTEGTALISFPDSRPEPVEGDPALTGWYAIFTAQEYLGGQKLLMKLSSDKAFTRFDSPLYGKKTRFALAECFWKCADMTGQKITLKKYADGLPFSAMLAYLKFVPLDDDEIEEYKKFISDNQAKRIYASNDVNNQVIFAGKEGCFSDIAEDLRDSDVEWLSIENIGYGDYGYDPDLSRYRECCEIAHRYSGSFTFDDFSDIVRQGHENGLKMCGSFRMGMWCCEYPEDKQYLDSEIWKSSDGLHCVDRDGEVCEQLSYAYPEVRRYITERFLEMLPCGVDAVEMLFSRGLPYVLFEEPVRDIFSKKYPGTDIRTLPQDDIRVRDIHCGIITDFIRELRAALDKRCEELEIPRVRLHLRGMFSLYDNISVGIDLEKLSSEGLIDTFISSSFRLHERLDGDVFTDETHEFIDIEKYHKYTHNSEEDIICKINDDFDFIPPLIDSKGEQKGPKNLKERVEEYNRTCEKYGVDVYYDIMPRNLTPDEYIRRAKELYEAGASGIALWDVICRTGDRTEWNTARFTGHKDELDRVEDCKNELVRIKRILRIAGKNVIAYRPSWGA